MIVTSRHRKAVLKELHEAHPGMTRTKGLARMFVCWPGIDGDIERTVRLCRECQKLHDCIAQQCDFAQGQVVYARNFREGERWIPGYIVEVMGPVSYNIEVEDGRHWKRQKDHIRSRLVVPDNSSDIPIPDTTLSRTPLSHFQYFLNLLL